MWQCMRKSGILFFLSFFLSFFVVVVVVVVEKIRFQQN